MDMAKYMKEYYSTAKDSWGDFEDEYYILLNCLDRLQKECYDKYGSVYKAEKALGYCHGELMWRFNSGITPNLKGLKRLCKGLDISFQWAILGEGSKKYVCKDINFENLKKVYDTGYYNNKNMKVGAAICMARHGKTASVPLKYLIRIARQQRVTIDYLLGANNEEMCM